MPEKAEFIECINNISAGLEKGKNLIRGGQIDEFGRECKSIVKEMEGIFEEKRTLKIGIVGQVKAGKSSFLNALIFKGEDVLPKAPTPMTAALTKINYSESPSAKIFFYQECDWEIIQSLSDEYEKAVDEKFREARENYERSLLRKTKNFNNPEGMPTRKSIEMECRKEFPRNRECREITKMVEERELRPSAYLGKTETIPPCELTEYNRLLNDYIGVEGRFTPLVSHTELYFDNPLLKDIEIIDTPGLNDAVLSRSQKTKDFLIICDVVFLLSSVGQFMSAGDIDFIVQTLPNEGIDEAVLVGSKFDTGILKYKDRTADFMKAFDASRANYLKHAADSIGKRARGPHHPRIIDKLKAAPPPFFVSSLLYSAAKKKKAGKALNEEEENILNRLKSLSGFSDTPEFLFDLSGIVPIRDKKLPEIKNNKEDIIREHVNGFLGGKVKKLAKILEDIKSSAQMLHNTLLKSEKDTLHDSLEKLENVLASIGPDISRVFIDNIREINISFQRISINISAKIDEFTEELNVAERIQVDYKGLFKHKRIESTIKFAYINDAIVSIRHYIDAIQKSLLDFYEYLLDRDSLKDKIKDIVKNAYDLSNKNFNQDEIVQPIEQMLNEFTVYKIPIDQELYNNFVFDEFSSAVVEDNEVGKLKETQEKVLQKIAKFVKDELEKERARIENAMRQRSETIESDTRGKIIENYELISQNLNDKTENLRRYNEFIDAVTEYQKNLWAL